MSPNPVTFDPQLAKQKQSISWIKWEQCIIYFELLHEIFLDFLENLKSKMRIISICTRKKGVIQVQLCLYRSSHSGSHISLPSEVIEDEVVVATERKGLCFGRGQVSVSMSPYQIASCSYSLISLFLEAKAS